MRKVFISVFITVLTFFFFSGCYDAIFQEIRTEVELNEGSISRFINNIIRVLMNEAIWGWLLSEKRKNFMR